MVLLRGVSQVFRRLVDAPGVDAGHAVHVLAPQGVLRVGVAALRTRSSFDNELFDNAKPLLVKRNMRIAPSVSEVVQDFT